MKHRRTVKLILPGLQLKLVGVFLGLSVLTLVFQYSLLMTVLVHFAGELPHDELLLLDALGPLVLRVVLFTAVALLPLTLLVGILATHRVAGPIYRFRQFLKDVIDGKRPADCRLRKGDDLQDLCALINEATAPVRARGVENPAQAPDVIELRRAS